LCRADELPAVFDARLTPSELLALLKAATVRYARDTRGWWLVAWTLPLFRGASFGLWVRQDRRRIAGQYRSSQFQQCSDWNPG
jgi:hypothetical protein